jgi:serine/threonine protein kinase
MSDIWALGCILYEMCALQQAWNGSNLLGLVYKIVQEKCAVVDILTLARRALSTSAPL